MPAVSVQNVAHRYGERAALGGVSFDVPAAQIFGLLGPNGSGKTTLFRLLCTLLPLQSGRAAICESDVASNPDAVRRHIGVTFQSPSLDGKLTVKENLTHQGHLYGLSGRVLANRREEVLRQLGVEDRAHDYVEKLSGGLKRRVEIAKCLLHQPRVLLLDEPSTGLDPGARHDLWEILQRLRNEFSVTILVSTHLMEEADRCTQLAILDVGQLVALGTPDELRSRVGGDALTIQTDQPEALAQKLREHRQVEVRRFGDSLRIEQDRGYELLADIAREFSGEFRSLTLGKPTLDDVFIKLTGKKLDAGEPAVSTAGKRGRHG